MTWGNKVTLGALNKVSLTSRELRLTTAIAIVLGLSVQFATLNDGHANEGTDAGVAALDDGLGFSISVDGEPVSGGGIKPPSQPKTKPDRQRAEDVALEAVDIQVKFDGLGVEPRLNVATADQKRVYAPGATIEFVQFTNYPRFIERSEVLIYNLGDEPRAGLQGGFNSSKPLKVVSVNGGKASWTIPADATGRYSYVLRAYDAKGRFDETAPLMLVSSSNRAADKDVITHEETRTAAENGSDRAHIRNIPIHGGAVTIFGRNVPAGYSVETLGESIVTDDENKFVIQRILPPGDHVVEVDVNGLKDGNLAFDREINIPDNEFFYVGLADLTFGRRIGSSSLVETAPGEFDRNFSRGRLAFYLKGKIKGKYLLTAAADTQEEDHENLFSNLGEKDPRALLRRIDPDDYYPVYGDDSTIVEDAPTQGKFYVRLERGESHVLWGNYKTKITGTEFARLERGLYGAQAVLKTEKTTSFGEPVAEVNAYGAQPDTLPQRDVLRGTGGSVYFLTQQDVTSGSEIITIEVRDPVSNIVRSRQVLRFGEDYEFDYIQGVVILKSPLNSTARGSALVSESALGDDTVNLVVQYEYTPALTDVDGFSYGGRAQAWISDKVQVGVTGIKEETGAADQRLLEADVKVRLGENSYVRGEVAQSRGAGFGTSNSINGGLTINNVATAGTANRKALAYRTEAHIDLSDFSDSTKGKVGAYFERRGAGFSSLDTETNVTQRIAGAFANIELSEEFKLQAGIERFDDANNRTNLEADLSIAKRLGEKTELEIGGRFFDVDNPTATTGNGARGDLAARLTRQFTKTRKAWLFGQATVARSGSIDRNDRFGVGAEVGLTDHIAVKGEASYGTSGPGGELGLTYEPSNERQYYAGYRLNTDSGLRNSSPFNGPSLGSFVTGGRHRIDDLWSVTLENSYDLDDDARNLTSTYGVSFKPNSFWTYDGNLEYGNVRDDIAGSLRRVAVSAGVGYKDKENLSFKVKSELRFENSSTVGLDRNTYLVTGNLSYKQNKNWRLLLNADAVISESNQASFLDGDYIEASIGYAYRPVKNDKLNALFKYNYLFELPGPDQVTVQGNTLGPAQRSHIFNADAVYDLTKRLSIGGKYGFRIGEVSATRAAENFVKSSAHLGILRADFHVVNNWDFTLEGRVLVTPEVDSTDYGALAAVYRHVGKNLKFGVGYNFGRFSDDVSDVTQDDQGVFLNLVGKF
ncbi:MAG: TonB-dependent receptor [Hyphomicrobiales bacterium]